MSALKRARLRFWMLAMDVISLAGGFGSPVYLRCARRASDCVDWEEQ